MLIEKKYFKETPTDKFILNDKEILEFSGRKDVW
jgi:hypothetical protein